mgnify:CR=1 FL=1
MATRARIAIQQGKQIIGAYQHWDGYPGGLGYNLVDNWYTADKVTKAIKLGDSSKWGSFIGEKIDFDDRHADSYDYQNVYYTPFFSRSAFPWSARRSFWGKTMLAMCSPC